MSIITPLINKLESSVNTRCKVNVLLSKFFYSDGAFSPLAGQKTRYELINLNQTGELSSSDLSILTDFIRRWEVAYQVS